MRGDAAEGSTNQGGINDSRDGTSDQGEEQQPSELHHHPHNQTQDCQNVDAHNDADDQKFLFLQADLGSSVDQTKSNFIAGEAIFGSIEQ